MNILDQNDSFITVFCWLVLNGLHIFFQTKVFQIWNSKRKAIVYLIVYSQDFVTNYIFGWTLTENIGKQIYQKLSKNKHYNPNAFSQEAPFQGYLPMWQLPKCGISQVCPSRSARLLILAAALGPHCNQQ